MVVNSKYLVVAGHQRGGYGPTGDTHTDHHYQGVHGTSATIVPVTPEVRASP